jgi:hypothetical protein
MLDLQEPAQLTRAETKVLRIIRAQTKPVDLEQLGIATLLAPDVVVKAIAVLIESGQIGVHRTLSDRLLTVTAVSPS